MDLEEIKVLAEIMSKTGLTTLEWGKGGESLRLECIPNVIAQENGNPARSIGVIGSDDGPTMAVKAPADPQEEGTVVASPMVGVFYVAPSPDSDPYVQVGDKVKKGEVLCIIEAMKLMNEIQAEADGVIAEITAGNGQVVEYGQPLFRIV